MLFAVFAVSHCLCHSLQTDPLHRVQSGDLQVLADQSSEGLVCGDGEGIGEVGNWRFVRNIVFVLSGMAVVVVMQEGHEDCCHVLGRGWVHVCLEQRFEEANESCFDEFEPCECKTETPFQQYLIEVLCLCLSLQLFGHGLNVLLDIAEGPLDFSLVLQIDDIAIDVKQPIQQLGAERVTKLAYYYIKSAVPYFSVPRRQQINYEGVVC